jgi:hypothetical protein
MYLENPENISVRESDMNLTECDYKKLIVRNIHVDEYIFRMERLQSHSSNMVKWTNEWFPSDPHICKTRNVKLLKRITRDLLNQELDQITEEQLKTYRTVIQSSARLILERNNTLERRWYLRHQIEEIVSKEIGRVLHLQTVENLDENGNQISESCVQKAESQMKIFDDTKSNFSDQADSNPSEVDEGCQSSCIIEALDSDSEVEKGSIGVSTCSSSSQMDTD